MFYNVDEVFALAEQIERNGAAFYRRGAEIARNPQVKKLMEELAAWEDGHEKVFSRIRAQLSDDERSARAFDPEGDTDMYLAAMAGQHVFSTDKSPETMLRGSESPAEILDIALRFERDSILFFVGMKEAIPDRLGSTDVDHILREEFGHVAYLEQARRRLT